MTTLNETLNPISAAERVKINENWRLISARFSNLQGQLQLVSGGADVEAIIARIEQTISNAETATGNTMLALQQVSMALSDLETIMNDANILNQELRDALVEFNTTLNAMVYTGLYDNSFTYQKGNYVRLQKDSYVALKENTGIIPSDDGINWRLVAVGGIDGNGSVRTVNNQSPDADGNVTLDVPTKQEFDNLNNTAKKVLVNVQDFGAVGDGVTDDTAAIQACINATPDGSKIFFPKTTARYRITNSINLNGRNRLILEGRYSEIAYDRNVDGVIFDLNNGFDITIQKFVVGGTLTQHTIIRGNAVRHLHVSDCYFDGNKLAFDLYDCYWPRLQGLRMQSVYQAFNFRGAVNGFLISNVSIAGDGIESIISGSIGGSINGASFEGMSGRLRIIKSGGIDLSGNYFEGYDANRVLYYVRLGEALSKDTTGISLNGNLFYSGAKTAIQLQNVGGISITGNYIDTTNAVELYTFDGSNQQNINFVGNDFKGAPENAFVIYGPDNVGSVSPTYVQPIIMTNNQIAPRNLTGTELSFYNKSGVMTLKDSTKEGSVNTSRRTLAKTLTSQEEFATSLNLAREGTFLLFVSSFISNSSQQDGVYLVQRNINAVSNFYVATLKENNLVTVTSNGTNLVIKNIDTSSRYVEAKLMSVI